MLSFTSEDASIIHGIRLVQLKSTKQLLGRAGERFLILGMLTHSKEGKLCIEDADGSVELDFSKLVS